MSSDTSPTTHAPPTSSSNSSAAAMSTALCSLPPTCRSSAGTPSSPTPRAPSPSSTASHTTSRSSSSKARAIAGARPNSPSSSANDDVRAATTRQMGTTHPVVVNEPGRQRCRKRQLLEIANKHAVDLGLSWCPASVDFQVRAFALQAAGIQCSVSAVPDPPQEMVSRARSQIREVCSRLAALGTRLGGPNGGASCRCPAGFGP